MWRALLISVAIAALSAQAITQSDDIKFVYPDKVRSERDLSVCEHNEVCSVVHRRFFQVPVIQRLCRCVTGLECPWKWSASPDNQTMPLDNRSQLKFCESLGDLPECSPTDPAMNATVRTTVETLAARKNKTLTTVRKLTTAECRCPSLRYWKYSSTDHLNHGNGTITDTTTYGCQELAKCSAGDFCGAVRSDYFSTYYRCSCPTYHLCLFAVRPSRPVSELLYTGKAYDGICTPHSVPQE